MTAEELQEVKEIIIKSAGGCLCGHFESCSVCDGTERERRKAIFKKLDEKFATGVH